MDNSIKVTLFNSLKKSKELNETTRGDRPISPSKPLSTSCMSKKAFCCLDINAIEELLLKVNSLKIWVIPRVI